MASKPTGNPVGRPKIELDSAKVEALAALQCTYEEIASGLGISADTLERRRKEDLEIADAIKRGRERGQLSLRRMQYQAAKDGNVTMMIWLGKQWLGQRDKHEIEQMDKIKIEVVYDDSEDQSQEKKAASEATRVPAIDSEEEGNPGGET